MKKKILTYNSKTENYINNVHKKIKKKFIEFFVDNHKIKINHKFKEKLLGESFYKFILICYSFYISDEILISQKISDNKKFYIKNFNHFKNQILSNDSFKLKIYKIYLKLGLRKKKIFKIKKNKDKNDNFYDLLFKRIDQLKNIFLLIGYYLKNKNNNQSPKILIIESYFSLKNRLKLFLKSNTKIITAKFPNQISTKNKKFPKFRTIKTKDKFEAFIYSILEHYMPTLYSKDYKINIKNIKIFLNNFPEVKYIINESFLDNDYVNLILLLAKEENKIKHIYIEHNYISHPYIGNRIDYLTHTVDKFYSLGWKDKFNKKIIKGASLYPFEQNRIFKIKKYKILYVSHTSQDLFFSFRNVICERNGKIYYDKMKNFFSKIPKKFLKEIHHKPYPSNKVHGVSISLEEHCKEYFKYFNSLPNNIPAIKILPKAKICLIDHISTTFISALINNVPTIAIWHKEFHFLNKTNENFFKILIKENIVFSDLEDAKNFLLSVKDDPGNWWFKKSVQKAKNDFLDKNIGSCDQMLREIVNIANHI